MKMVTMKAVSRIALAGAVLIFLLSLILACSGKHAKKEEEKPEPVLAQESIEAFNKRDYYKAVEDFQTIKDRYPFSQFAVLAQLKLGDSHFNLAQYAEAIYEYEEFVKLHPENEAVPYVLYQTGMCYFNQTRGIDQDQTNTRKAVTEFQKLIQNYPDSPFKVKAENRLAVCLKNLAEYELYIGRFYFKNKKYQAAKDRFEGILKNFPDLGQYDEAMHYINECDKRLSMVKEEKTKKQEK
jgi:outer membrane protein assembly factor BamD